MSNTPENPREQTYVAAKTAEARTQALLDLANTIRQLAIANETAAHGIAEAAGTLAKAMQAEVDVHNAAAVKAYAEWMHHRSVKDNE
jgi:ABC-type nickel/cobalt efflux system permease component RcnA